MRQWNVCAVLAAVLVAGFGSRASAAAPVRFTFDRGIADESGGVRLRMRGDAGVIAEIAHVSGKAVAFRGGGKAIIESGPAGALNPARRVFAYGAAVRLARSQVRHGANVVQKGFAAAGSQFKLQLDGGRPSCVVVGTSSGRSYKAASRRSVANDAWHELSCTRSPSALVLYVDGAEDTRVSIPKDLVISNRHPLRLGGKNLSLDNDQFVGDMDNVFVDLR